MTYVPVPKSAPASPAVVPQAVGGAAAVTLSFGAGVRETSTTVTLTQNCAITVAAGAAEMDQVMTVDLLQGGAGGFVPTFTNVSWGGGMAPAFNTVAGKRDTIQLRALGGDVMGWPVAMSRLPLLSMVPGAPSSVVVTAGVLQVSVSAAGVAAFPAVTGYTVYRGISPGGEGAVPIAVNVGLPFVDTGVSAGTTYFYTVAAVNAAGTGPASPEGQATPLAASAVPGAPGGVVATAGVLQVTISAAAVSAVPAVTGYTVSRGVVAGGAKSVVAVNVTLPYVDGGLSGGTTYFYTVAAVNGAGTGAASVEVAATAATAGPPGHYALFSGTDSVMYASPAAAFNPGGAAFDMQAYVRMAAWATGGAVETNLWGCWDVNPANRLWRLGLTTDGRIRASWSTGAGASATATSGLAIGAAGGTDLWVRASVVPTSGGVTFSTSTDGVNWSPLGVSATASGSGAVQSPSTLPYLVIGANASAAAGPQAEQFYGRFYEARLSVGGVLITDPQIVAGGVVDAKGFAYAKSGSVAYV